MLILMESREGRNESESCGYHHREGYSEQICCNENDHQNHSLISSKIIVRRAISFIALAFACFVLYLPLSNPNLYHLPISNDPFRSQSQNSTKSNQSSLLSYFRNSSSPTDEFFHVNSTLVCNNSPPVHAPTHDSLLANSTHVSNVSTPIYAPPKDSFLQGNSSFSSMSNSSTLMRAPTEEKINSSTIHAPTDSSPVLDHSAPEHAHRSPGKPAPVFNMSSPTHAPEKLTTPVDREPDQEAKLAKMLSEAAMDDKTVIVTAVNAAWAAPNSLFDLFLESFKIGNGTAKLLNHLVVVALDLNGYSRCLELHPHCFALTTEGVDFSGEAVFMSEDYMKLVWRKIEFVLTVLQMGYNSIFTDADILWFRDPFPHLYMDADIQTSCDRYRGTPTRGIANTGFYYVKSNNRTVQFYKFWLGSRDKIPHDHDQNVFNKIRYDPFIAQTGIKIKLLSTVFYGGFCQPSKNLNLVCTMHANCCAGIDRKLPILKVLIEDWKKYMALPGVDKARTPKTWTVRRWCR